MYIPPKTVRYLRHFIMALLVLALAFPSTSFSITKKERQKINKEFKKYLKDGKSCYKRKMYEDAITFLEKALELKPKDGRVKKLIKKAEKKLQNLLRLSRGKELPRPVKIKARMKPKLSLDECIEIAIENHLPLKIQKKQLKLAEFRVLEAMRKLGPQLTAKFEESGGQINDRYYGGKRISLEGKQPVFYGGELVYAVKQAKVNVEVVRTEYERIKGELMLQVRKAYYSFDKTKKALEVQKELYREVKDLYGMAKAGCEAGFVTQIEFLKVTSQYNQAEFQFTSAEQDMELANLILQQAMNIDYEIDINEVKDPKIIEINLENCFNLANLNRPEIKIGQLTIDYYDYEIKIMGARANWPRVDLLGMYANAYEDYKAIDLADPALHRRNLGPEYYLGAKVSIPFWGSTFEGSLMEENWQPVVGSFRGTKSTTKSVGISFFNKLDDISSAWEADVERARQRDELKKKKQEVVMEVKETFYKYKKAVVLIEVAKNKVKFQTKQAEIMRVKQELGDADFSTVIEELIKLSEERFSYIQALADYYSAVSSLNKVIGINDYFDI